MSDRNMVSHHWNGPTPSQPRPHFGLTGAFSNIRTEFLVILITVKTLPQELGISPSTTLLRLLSMTRVSKYFIMFPNSHQWCFLADNYNPAHPSYLRFTQVVWRSTTELGCSVSVCENFFDSKHGRANFFVCLYNPAGNVVGQAA